MTPQEQFKAYAKQLEEGENGDNFFTGNIPEVLAFLAKYEDFEPKVIEHEGDHVVLYSTDDNYWGSGPDTETAHRYLIGAILDQGEEGE